MTVKTKEYIHNGVNVSMEYEKIFKSLPKNMNELVTKWEIEKYMPINKDGGKADVYFAGGQAIKVNRTRRNQLAKEMLYNVKVEFTNLELANTLGLYVPSTTGIFLITKDNKSSIALGMRNLGNLTIENIIRENHKDKNEAIYSWNNEKNKLSEILSEGTDTTIRNAIWVPEEKQTYLIDTGGWKLKGVDYSKYNNI